MSLQTRSFKSQRRSHYQHGTLSSDEVKEQRRIRIELARQQHRESLLQTKRLRRADSSFGTFLEHLSEDHLSEELLSIKEILLAASCLTGQVEVLTRLKHITSAAGEGQGIDIYRDKSAQIFLAVAKSEIIPILVRLLTPRAGEELSEPASYQACWILSTLSSGHPSCAEQVLLATPLLLTFLSGSCGMRLAELSAWTVGNLAADHPKVARIVVDNGGAHALALLIATEAPRSSEPATLAALQSATWALSTIVRLLARDSQVDEVLQIEGFVPALLTLLTEASDPLLATEVAWLVAYIAGSCRQMPREADFLDRLLRLLRTTMSARAGGRADGEYRALMLPSMRATGNLVACCQPRRILQALASQAGSTKLILECAARKDQATQREALWLLSNLVTLVSDEVSGRSLLLAEGGEKVLINLLVTGTFPLRREAAHAILNLLCVDPDLSPALMGDTVEAATSGILRQYGNMAQHGIEELDNLAIMAFTIALHHLPEIGPPAVEAVGGIEVLEKAQLRGDPDLQRVATGLLHTFFGDEYGL